MASNSRSWLTPQPSLVGKQQVALLQQAAMLLHTGARTVRRRRRLWFVLAALALLTAGALLLSRRAAEPRYVLVIDAGSSGTRMYAYTWRKGLGGGGAAPLLAGVPSSAAPHKVPRRAMPSKRAYQRVETEPGLDHYKDDAEGLQAQALGPLLEWAEAVVPRRQWAQTPVFLFGTAGLRKLSEGQQGVLLAGVRGVLQRSAFRFLPAWARIISGTDEGVYGWVALNYLEGRLRAGSDTLGALDLGGSSLEVTFAADSVPWREDAVNSTVLGAVHQLYSHVHHHYGLNDAFDQSVTILLARQLASGSVRGAASKQGSQRQQAQLGGALLPHSDDAATDELTSSRTASDSRRAAEKAGVMASSIGLATTGQAAADASFNADTRADDSTQGQRRLQAPQALLRRVLVTGDTPGSGSAVGAEQQQEQQQGAHRGLLAEVLEEVQHPCLHDGFRQVYTRLAQEGSGGLAPLRVMLVGRSDYEACQQLALAVVDASVPCSAPPCALGTPQPSTVGHRFVALTGFFVVYRFFRLPHNASVDALEEAGRHFCAKSWLQVQQERGGELMLEKYCFRAPYIASLVTHGLQLNGKQLQVGGGEVGWTLGAALAEGYRLAGLSRISNEVVFSWPSVGGRLGAMRILAAGSFVAVVYLIASWWRHRCSVPTRRNGIRITSKGSAELLHLSDGMDGSASSIPTGSDFSPPLISAGTPLKSARTVGWAATARPGGAVATQAGESSSARMHTQPWAGHDPAAGSAGSSGSAADAGLQRQRSHSNLNRLGRSRTFSRRSLAAASPDGEWLNSVVTS